MPQFFKVNESTVAFREFWPARGLPKGIGSPRKTEQAVEFGQHADSSQIHATVRVKFCVYPTSEALDSSVSKFSSFLKGANGGREFRYHPSIYGLNGK